MTTGRRYGHSHTPVPTTTGDKLTRVRDPRATVRFSLDERVSWDEGGGSLVEGTIVGFVEDESMARVRLKDGTVVLWPAFSARFKRLQVPDFDESDTVTGREATMPAPRYTLRDEATSPYAEFSVRAQPSVHDEPTRVPGMTDPGRRKR